MPATVSPGENKGRRFLPQVPKKLLMGQADSAVVDSLNDCRNVHSY